MFVWLLVHVSTNFYGGCVRCVRWNNVRLVTNDFCVHNTGFKTLIYTASKTFRWFFVFDVCCFFFDALEVTRTFHTRTLRTHTLSTRPHTQVLVNIFLFLVLSLFPLYCHWREKGENQIMAKHEVCLLRFLWDNSLADVIFPFRSQFSRSKKRSILRGQSCREWVAAPADCSVGGELGDSIALSVLCAFHLVGS